MEIGAIITSIIAGVGLVYSAIRIAHDRAPLRRFERLAATRKSLAPGSRTEKSIDKALEELARSIAYKESGDGHIQVVMSSMMAMLVIGTLGVVVGAGLYSRGDIPGKVIAVLVITGGVFSGVAFIMLTTIMISQFIMYMRLRRYRLARRLIKRSRARKAKLKHQELRPRAVEKRKALKLKAKGDLRMASGSDSSS